MAYLSFPRLLGGLALGWVAFTGCHGSGDEPPVSTPADPPPVDTSGAREPLTCDDLGTMNEWGPTLCETGGNNACGGEGEATSDCAHCCPAPLPTSQELAAQKGWAGVACENDGDGACNGLGEPTFDCDVACEAPAAPPTCADVAAEWGFGQAVCETAGNGACGGKGIATSDCARCCDAPLPVDPGPELGDDMDEFNEAPEPGDEGEGPSDPPPDPGPAPDRTCGEIGTASGWPNAVCETSSNKACGGKGVASSDCKVCCAGTDGSGSNPSTSTGPFRVVTYNLTGVTKKQLHAMARELRKARPTLIGLQEATESQMDYLADQVGTDKMPMDYRHFAPVRQEGSVKVGIALLSKLPLDGVESESLPEGGKLLRAEVTSSLGSFTFGTAWLGDSARDAARVKARIDDAQTLLTVGLAKGAGSSVLAALKPAMLDGWSDSFGPGDTTADGKRLDLTLRSTHWGGASKGEVIGAAAGGLHRAVAQTYDARKLGGCQKAGCVKVPNPATDVSFPDPFIALEDDVFHAFATGGELLSRTSIDLSDWEDEGNPLDATAAWQDKPSGVWAPAVYQARRGDWVMYYAAKVDGASEQRCIGKAVSSAPGDFSPAGKVVCEPTHWSIDPSVFRDPGGKDYLLWRQDTGAHPAGTLRIQRLDANGDPTGSPQELLHRAESQPSWEFDAQGGVMENPAMVFHRGRYHLFYSGNRWETGKYASGHAVCKTPLGPCQKTSVKTPWRGSKGPMKGPGGADTVRTPEGTRLMYMHGWDQTLPVDKDNLGDARRKLWVYRLTFRGKTPRIRSFSRGPTRSPVERTAALERGETERVDIDPVKAAEDMTFTTVNIGRDYGSKADVQPVFNKIAKVLGDKKEAQFIGWQEINEKDLCPGDDCERRAIDEAFTSAEGWKTFLPTGKNRSGGTERTKEPVTSRDGGKGARARMKFGSPGWDDVSPTRFITIVHYPERNLSMVNAHFIAGAFNCDTHGQRVGHWRSAWKAYRNAVRVERAHHRNVIATGDLNRDRQKGPCNPDWTPHKDLNKAALDIGGRGIDYVFAIPARGRSFAQAKNASGEKKEGIIEVLVHGKPLDGHNAHWVTGRFE